MRINLLSILILLGFMHAYGMTRAQKISFKASSSTAERIFSEIRKQTGYSVLYSGLRLKEVRFSNINFNDAPLEEVLNHLSNHKGWTYEIEDKTIILRQRRVEIISLQQNREIIGTVVDQNNKPIQGVTIYLKGSEASGTISDPNGRFVLEVTADEVILVFRYVGYLPQERVLSNGENNIQVNLSEDIEGIEEVVVVGFGTQRKVSLVGSQSTVNPSELKLPVRSVSTALAGRLAGIVATQRSGAPGYDNADLLIRGVSTLASSPQGPLIVIDGVPGRGMNNIDPEDIESFTVLKDATATAVYGTRGANGVLIIETKKGRTGRPIINVEANRAVTQFTQLPDFVDAPTYMKLYNEGLTARNRNPTFLNDVIERHVSQEDPDLYPNVNWFNELFEPNGSNERINLNVRGGAQNARYYIAAGYFGEMGMFKTDDIDTYNSSLKFNRFNFLSNVDVDVTKTTKIQLGISGAVENNNFGGTDIQNVFEAATKTPPYLIPPIYSNGLVPQVIGGGGASVSPYVMMTQYGYTSQFNSTIRSNINVNQDLGFFISGLSARLLFSYDSYNFNRIRREKRPQTYFADGRDAEGNLLTSIITPSTDILEFAASRGGNRNFYTESALNYSQSFGKHDVSGMLLYNQSDYINASASDVIAAIPFRLRGLTGRATYGYSDRYFIESNFGYTGSENFTPRNRYGLFPSIGGGWLLSKEKFFEPLSDVISHFKLRYTYGLSGNSNTNNRFLFLTRINDGGGYTFGPPDARSRNTKGLEEGMVGSEVSWETARKQNLGIELNLFKNDLQLIVELFKEKRDGILVRDQTLPNMSGLTLGNLPYANIGETRNKGIDLTLTYNKSFSSDAFATFRGTFTYNKNVTISDGRPPWAYPWLDPAGQRISQRFGLLADGFFQTEEEVVLSARQSGDVRPGDIKYRDLNADGIIDSYDRAPIGYGDVPSIIYGLSAGGGYKKFDINLFFQGAGMVDFLYASGDATQPFLGGANVGNLYTAVLDRWTTENPNPHAFYPRLSTNQDITSNYEASSHWVRRSDYLRLKSAEIGYNFSFDFMKRIYADKMRLFLNGTNLLTFSKWKVWDPELGDGRGTAYPNISTYNVGFRITFQ